MNIKGVALIYILRIRNVEFHNTELILETTIKAKFVQGPELDLEELYTHISNGKRRLSI